MEKFICDRRVKCRTACSSDTSGSAGGAARRKCAGISPALRLRPGRRELASTARRPGLLSSNINGSRSLSLP